MKRKIIITAFKCLFLLAMAVMVRAQNKEETFRPQIHFTPAAKWMNDPNGMVYHNGTYHLFYQHNPHSSVWGPMHWGYATSKDLVRWKRQPIALFPDSLGAIFSGSAVVDKNNTAGFGMKGQSPLVAIFTHHEEKGEKAGRSDFQNQSLAYSLDNGKTWIKYKGNPVLRSPGIKDFRDPKVMWHEQSKKWLMALAASDRIVFYSSPDLKQWNKESEFGEKAGAHGGVWECPDLFPLMDNGKEVWVLIVNLNPGGPNKGSATQYFLGDFDGKKFSAYSTDTKWLDYGPDEYAGITWYNTGGRKIFLGWMSNWLYANVVPTPAWRNAMTIPRDLTLKRIQNELFVASRPVPELASIHLKKVVATDVQVVNTLDPGKKIGPLKLPCRLNLDMNEIKNFSLVFSNEAGDELVIGYDKKQNKYYIDRAKSGQIDFHNEFAARFDAPRFTNSNTMDLSLVMDVSSVELFADGGLSVMTAIFFPNKPYNKVIIHAPEKVTVKKLEYISLKSIW